MGQLDGGHILRARWPLRASTVSWTCVVLLLVASAWWWPWAIWAAAAVVLAPPRREAARSEGLPTTDGGAFAPIAGAITLALCVTFRPFPIPAAVIVADVSTRQAYPTVASHEAPSPETP